MSHLPFEIHGWGHQSRFVKAAAATWRYTLGEQLKAHATQDKFVLLVGVGFELKAQLMNFICSLNRVGMSNHYVIAALDHPMYRWGVLITVLNTSRVESETRARERLLVPEEAVYKHPVDAPGQRVNPRGRLGDPCVLVV